MADRIFETSHFKLARAWKIGTAPWLFGKIARLPCSRTTTVRPIEEPGLGERYRVVRPLYPVEMADDGRQVTCGPANESAGQSTAPEQTSAESQIPFDGRQVTAAVLTASSGQYALVPVQASATSQTPAEPRFEFD